MHVLENHTAGDPMREGIRWTNLTLEEISQRLAKAGTPVGVHVVKQLLKKHGYVKRKAKKQQAMGTTPNRNKQFEKIARLRKKYQADGNPILSIDTKKKELLGNFCRPGRLYTQGVIEAFDHDFPCASSGKAVPHGIYDLSRNVGHINLGRSHDTSEFACDSLYRWWSRYGRKAYPNATSILVLCDSGGSNNYRHNIFKADLQRLVNKIGLPMRVAHYPSHCSKYNPIDHRLFPHVTRACQGVILKSLDLFKQLILQTRTRTGLRVTVGVIKKTYQKGREIADNFWETANIVFDRQLPHWNYVVQPTT